LTYWRGFALIPQMTREEDKLLVGGPSGASGPAADRLVGKWRPALQLLHEGAAVADCAWGINYAKEGPNVMLPHLGKARQLARGAWLRARWLWRRGQREAALADVTAAVRLARHAGVQGRENAVAALVQVAIENQAVEVASEFLADAESVEIVKRALAELSPGKPRYEQIMKRAVLAEKNVYIPWIRGLVREYSSQGRMAELRRRLLNELFHAAGDNQDATAPDNVTADDLLDMLDETAERFDQLAALMELGVEESESGVNDLLARIHASRNHFSRLLLPALGKLRRTAARASVAWALLEAAVEVRGSGAAGLEAVKDPCGAGKFGYRELAHGGFELTSQLTHEGRPVALRIGGARVR